MSFTDEHVWTRLNKL